LNLKKKDMTGLNMKLEVHKVWDMNTLF